MKKNKFLWTLLALPPTIGAFSPLLVSCSNVYSESLEEGKTQSISQITNSYYNRCCEYKDDLDKLKIVRDSSFEKLKSATTYEVTRSIRLLADSMLSAASEYSSTWEPTTDKGIYPLYKTAIDKINTIPKKYAFCFAAIYGSTINECANHFDNYDYYIHFMNKCLDAMYELKNEKQIDLLTTTARAFIRQLRYCLAYYDECENSFLQAFNDAVNLIISCDSDLFENLDSVFGNCTWIFHEWGSERKRTLSVNYWKTFVGFFKKDFSFNKQKAFLEITSASFAMFELRQPEACSYFLKLYQQYTTKIIECKNGKELIYSILMTNILTVDGERNEGFPQEILDEIEILFRYIDAEKNKTIASNIAESSKLLFNYYYHDIDVMICFITRLEELIAILKKDSAKSSELLKARGDAAINIYSFFTIFSTVYDDPTTRQCYEEIIKISFDFIFSSNDVIKIKSLSNVAAETCIRIHYQSSAYKISDHQGIYYIFNEFLNLLKKYDNTYSTGLAQFYADFVSVLDYENLSEYATRYNFLKKHLFAALENKNVKVRDSIYKFNLYINLLTRDMWIFFNYPQFLYADFGYDYYLKEAFLKIKNAQPVQAEYISECYCELIIRLRDTFVESFDKDILLYGLSMIEGIKKSDNPDVWMSLRRVARNIFDSFNPENYYILWKPFAKLHKKIINEMINGDEIVLASRCISIGDPFVFDFPNSWWDKKWVDSYAEKLQGFLNEADTSKNVIQAQRIGYVIKSWIMNFWQNEDDINFVANLVNEDIKYIKTL